MTFTPEYLISILLKLLAAAFTLGAGYAGFKFKAWVSKRSFEWNAHKENINEAMADFSKKQNQVDDRVNEIEVWKHHDEARINHCKESLKQDFEHALEKQSQVQAAINNKVDLHQIQIAEVKGRLDGMEKMLGHIDQTTSDMSDSILKLVAAVGELKGSQGGTCAKAK